MKIVIGNDHAGVDLKLKIVEFESTYSPVAPQYVYSGEIAREKEKISIANGKKIVLLLILANVGFGDVAQIIGDYYSIDKGKVYYKNKILEGANPKTAELIGSFLLKDDKNVYFEGKILEGVDYNTFEVLPNGDGKDKNRSYEYLPKDEWKWF